VDIIELRGDSTLSAFYLFLEIDEEAPIETNVDVLQKFGSRVKVTILDILSVCNLKIILNLKSSRTEVFVGFCSLMCITLVACCTYLNLFVRNCWGYFKELQLCLKPH
jgi:hypothetical protein